MTVVLLFFGASWDVLLWSGGALTLIALAAGLGALLALDRRDRRGDLAACGLLVVAAATFSTGLAFLAGAALDVLLRRDRWKRLWVFLVPGLLYGAWTLWSLQFRNSQVRPGNVVNLPVFAFDGLAAVAAGLAGLYRAPGSQELSFRLEWGYPLAVLALALLGVYLVRARPVPVRVWIVLGTALSFWVLAGLVVGPLRAAHASRYLYPGALLVLLVVAELARGVRLSPPTGARGRRGGDRLAAR